MEAKEFYTVIDLQNKVIEKLEDLVKMQKQMIKERDEIIIIQKSILEVEEKLSELKMKSLMTPCPN